MIITLCGSARFEDEFKDMNIRLTLEGHIVHTLARYPSDAGCKEWYTPKQKEILDEVYLRKIDNSDGILVLNVDGYIGTGGKKEILYAHAEGKDIFFLSSIIPQGMAGPGQGTLRDIHQASKSLGILMKRWTDY